MATSQQPSSGCCFARGAEKVPTKRFGRTELRMPVISCGGMRFQAPGLAANDPAVLDRVPQENLDNLAQIVTKAVELGITHFETAKYGCSELILGHTLRSLKIPRDEYILQTKVGPSANIAAFRKSIATSIQLLAPEPEDYIDLVALHGINRTKELEWIFAPGGCYSVLEEWRAKGKIRFFGFSTHGMTPAIVAAIDTGKFDYVNLHYHYIGSYTASGSGPEKNANWAAVQAAKRHDMGVFIISPFDKGGILYHPPQKFADLVAPLHPIQFQTLWGLRQADVHTLSLGAARPQDFDLAYSAAIRLGEVERANPSLLSAPIARLEEAAISALGNDWWQRWNRGLPDSFGHIDDLKPDGTDTDIAANPFGINFTMAAWLYTISEAWGFVAYAKARYAQYVNNDKAWGAKIADGETAEEIIDSWTWTPGRSIGATEPSDKPALLHVLRHSAVGAEKMLDVLYRVHEVLKPGSEVPEPPRAQDLNDDGFVMWPARQKGGITSFTDMSGRTKPKAKPKI